MVASSSKPASRKKEPAEPPPSWVVKPVPTNLPVERTPLIGREAEVAAVRDALRRDDVGLVTLTGVGGSGKTRLAIEAARELGEAFPDGVWFVDLTVVRDAGEVADAIAKVLAVPEKKVTSPLERLLAALTDLDSLLVLDNFEHVISAATVVGELLAGCRGLKVLATSREPLRLQDEHERDVPPLRVPEIERVARQGVPSDLVPVIAHFPAVALFVARARMVQPDFDLSAANAKAVVEICRRLDGMPLAIELAASRVRVLPPAAILDRLEHRLDLLTGGPRDRPERQQTLRATIDWSYQLLEPVEQAVFRRLSVFVGGFTLEAAAAVAEAAGPTDRDILDAVDGLVSRSLVRQTSTPSGEPRFALLETLREFGLERLSAAGELENVRQAHAIHFLALGMAAEPGLVGPDKEQWLDRLEAEHPNLRASLEWCLEAGRENDPALGLASALRWFWDVRGHFTEGRRWLDRALAHCSEPTSARARALNAAGVLAWRQDDYAAAQACFAEALDIARRSGDEESEGRLLGNLGIIAASVGDFGAAKVYYEQSLTVLRKYGNLLGIGNALNNLGTMALQDEDLVTAQRLFTEGLAAYREIGDRQFIANSTENLAIILMHQGAYEAAAPLYEEALGLRQELSDRFGVAISLSRIGSNAQCQGDLPRAARLHAESLAIQRDLDDLRSIGDSLIEIGMIIGSPVTRPIVVAGAVRPKGAASRTKGAIDPDRLRLAVQLVAAADAMHREIGYAPNPVDVRAFAVNTGALRAALGGPAFDGAWSLGAAKQVQQVVSEAIAAAEALAASPMPAGADADPAARPAASPRLGGLSEREVEVAALIAEGRTYREIADALSVSVKTVEKHVGNILGKLGLGNRSQVAVWAQTNGLLRPPAG